jgi:hypothetical protein
MNAILIPWVIAMTILLFVAAYWIYMLEKRLGDLESRSEALIALSEMTPAEDDESLLAMLQRVEAQEARFEEIEPLISQLASALPHVVQGLAIVRYNAFEGVGGDQSFSIALVDRLGNGAVLSGLNTGDDVRVYAKPVQNWKASYGLSPDEQRALGEARGTMEAVSAP